MIKLDDPFNAPSAMPSHEDIRVRRLEIAISKLHAMPVSDVRDELIFDLEGIIGKILLTKPFSDNCALGGVGDKTPS